MVSLTSNRRPITHRGSSNNEASDLDHGCPIPRPSYIMMFVEGIIIILEKLVALLVLIAVSPLMLAIATAIRLDSPGGAIFSHRRIARFPRRKRKQGSNVAKPDASGKDSKAPSFVLYKFRTYYANSDQMAPKRARFDFDHNTINDVHLQLKDDPRATRVGKFLRRTSLDELPNLVNIIKGDMRFIGPRPEVIEMLRYYHGERRIKFHVKPGITGLAQVNGRGKLTFEQTVRYDLEYVQNRSLLLDFIIMLKTVKVVLTGDGAF